MKKVSYRYGSVFRSTTGILLKISSMQFERTIAEVVDGEGIQAAFKTLRDVAVITSERPIPTDGEDLPAKRVEVHSIPYRLDVRKVEIYSIPYRSIDMYSSENAAGFLDFDAELEFWMRGGIHVKLKILKKVDVRKFDRLIAQNLLK